MVKQPWPAWRAPVSSTVTNGAPASPARSTASSSARNRSSLRAQQPNHLPLGDRQAKPDQELHDPFAGHLALKMEHQHQPMQMGAATADDPRTERRGQRLAVRRLPALPPIKRRLGFQHQVLNDDLLIALAARARRGLNRHRHGLGRSKAETRQDRAAASTSRPSRHPPAPSLSPSRKVCTADAAANASAARSRPSASGYQPAARAALSFSFSARTRPSSPINRRTRPTSSAAVMRSSKSIEPGVMPGLNQPSLTFPSSAREFAPVTRLSTKPLISLKRAKPLTPTSFIDCKDISVRAARRLLLEIRAAFPGLGRL